MNKHITSKKLFVFILSILCSIKTSYAAYKDNSSTESSEITIAKPLVLLTGATKYDTNPDLPTVEDELIGLYNLFKHICGYEVKSTFFDEEGNIISDKNNVIDENGDEMKTNDEDEDKYKGRLSKERFGDFLKKQYDHLYDHRKEYDALIFIFSGHGFGNKKGNEVFILSDFYKKNPVNYKFLSDIHEKFTHSTDDNYIKDFGEKPKIFFDLACRGGGGGKSMNLRKKRGQYKGVGDNHKAANQVTYFTTTPGNKTAVEVGEKFVEFLSQRLKGSLNKKGRQNSLHAIMKNVFNNIMKYDGCPDVSGPLAFNTDSIYFSSVLQNSYVNWQCLHIMTTHIIQQDTNMFVLRSRKDDFDIFRENRDTFEINGSPGKEEDYINNQVNTVTWDDTSTRFASAANNGEIKIWNPQGRCMVAFKAKYRGCYSTACWASQSSLICSCSGSGIDLWHASNGGHKCELKDAALGRAQMDWSSDRGHLACFTDSYVGIYDLEKLTRVTSFKKDIPSNPRAIRWCGDHKRVAIAGSPYGVQIWDTTSLQKVGTIPTSSNLRDVAWAKDSRYIAYASRDNGTHIWDVRHQEKLLCSLGNEAANSVTWSSNGKYIITGGGYYDISKGEGYIKIYDTQNYKLLENVAPYNPTRSVALSPDDQYLASGHDWGIVKLWK